MMSLVASLKQYNTQSRISLQILKWCSSNLASEMSITKEAKWHLLCHCHDNSYATSPVLMKTKILRFYPKQGSSTQNNLMGIVKTIWEPFVCQARLSVPLKKIANEEIWFFTERDWSRECFHGNDIVGVILFLLWCMFLVPSLKNTAPIFLEIFFIEGCTVLVKPPITSSMANWDRNLANEHCILEVDEKTMNRFKQILKLEENKKFPIVNWKGDIIWGG